jgi:biotin carboxylase
MTTILAMSSYFKGEDLLRECRRQGARTILLTEEKLKDDPWPRDSIDEVFLMPNLGKLPDMIYAVSYLARTEAIDRIIPLDEYDVEMAGILREHLRLPGMGMTQTKNFRDKLAMRQVVRAAGLREPAFSPVVNHDAIREFTRRVPAPWVLKPRLEAGAMGIKRISHEGELWDAIHQLGDQASFRVLEQYVPGDVYHVDALTVDGETLFVNVSRYGRPPLNVSHDGGVFTTYTLSPDDPDAEALVEMNRRVIEALGHRHGPTHAEFIKAHGDGQFNFLEIAARVGGAHIADLVAAATGVNLWAEWARLEIATARGDTYTLPPVKHMHGSLLVCLARQQWPDLSVYDAPEVVWKLHKEQHAGLILVSEDRERIEQLRNEYLERFGNDFLAVAPAKEGHQYV